MKTIEELKTEEQRFIESIEQLEWSLRDVRIELAKLTAWAQPGDVLTDRKGVEYVVEGATVTRYGSKKMLGFRKLKSGKLSSHRVDLYPWQFGTDAAGWY